MLDLSYLSVRLQNDNNNLPNRFPCATTSFRFPCPKLLLTEILKDFRSYRPGHHRQFLEWVQHRAAAVNLKEFALKDTRSAGKPSTYVLVNAPQRLTHALILIQHCISWPQLSPRLPLAPLVLHSRVYPQEDISSYCYWWQPYCHGKLATRTTLLSLLQSANKWSQWLPNQLTSVLNLMAEIHDGFKTKGGLGKTIETIMEAARSQREALRKEVEKYCEERKVATPNGL